MFNPGKKNRRFGTKWRGFGQDNRMVIPESWHGDWRRYWERLTDYRAFELPVGGRELQFLVERPHPGCYHAVTPDDVAHLLGFVPRACWEELELFVFRQPTRKQRRLSGCWGRISYFSEIDHYSGLAIYLEALPSRWSWRASRSQDPEGAREIARLEELGVRVQLERRGYLLTSSPAADRQTQLYHTIPHELGHLEDYRLHARYALEDDEDSRAEADRRIDEGTPHYDHKPRAEKEAYAHRFSDELRRRLRAEHALPFPRRLDRERMRRLDVEESWFEPRARAPAP
jgi:hypothetical protein